MPTKSNSLAAKIKAAMEERDFLPSVVAFNTGLSRKKLRMFLDGLTELPSREIDKVLEFLDLNIATGNSEQKHWRNFTVNTVLFEAVSNDLDGHSLAYISDGENASGTLVTIGDREFIATAAHTIPLSRTSLILIGQGQHPLNRDDIKIVASGRMRGDNPDVGYIELEPGTTSRLGRVPLSIDRLCDAGPGQPGRIAFLYGCPFALIKNAVNPKRREKIIGIHSFTYPNSTMAVEEWPTVPRDAEPPRRSVDLFIPYDVTAETIVDRGGSGNRLPNPEGASGGGICQGIGPKKDGVWHVGKVKLIAIQSSWDKKRKYIRGVQIKQWVRLIEKDYPDLKKHLHQIPKP